MQTTDLTALLLQQWLVELENCEDCVAFFIRIPIATDHTSTQDSFRLALTESKDFAIYNTTLNTTDC